MKFGESRRMTVRKKQPARRETRPNSSEGTPPSGYRMRRFLAPELLIAGVSEIVAIAARARVTALLVGGLAMQHYGSDRLTGDLDFAACAQALERTRAPGLRLDVGHL